MALPARFSLLHSDLNGFLFASVGDEQNGIPLTVVSALTRLGLDPWEEAARLAALPKAVAAETLARMIAGFLIGRPGLSENLAVSRRLVELLPADKPAGFERRQPASAQDKIYLSVVLLLACVALGAAVLSSML
jgi:hypothetical protein